MARPTTFPVSVKGVAVHGGRVLLARNERDEWELPGGKLDPGETPEECVVRELAEESGWRVEPGQLIDVWLYPVVPAAPVLVVTYGCHPVTTGRPVLSDEHREIGLFTQPEVGRLRMPEGYRRSIAAWYRLLRR